MAGKKNQTNQNSAGGKPAASGKPARTGKPAATVPAKGGSGKPKGGKAGKGS